MPGEFLQQFPRVIGKGLEDVQLLDGHYEERPIISQPQCARCHDISTSNLLFICCYSVFTCHAGPR